MKCTVWPIVTTGGAGVMVISSGVFILLLMAALTTVQGKDVAYSNANQGRCLRTLPGYKCFSGGLFQTAQYWANTGVLVVCSHALG